MLKTIAILGSSAALALTFFVGCGAAQGPGGATGSGAGSLLNTNSGSGSTTLHGTVDSGGGRAVVCRNASGAILSVRSLDLYESDHTSHLMAAPALANLDEEWKRFATRMSLRFSDPAVRESAFKRVSVLKDQFLSQARFVSEKEAHLRMVDDSKEAFTVPSCPIEQLAYWEDDETILVQKDLWDVMPPRDQAALIAHEFIYSSYRSFGYRSSIFPRRVVGLAFSTQDLVALSPLPEAAFECESTRPASPDNFFAAGRDHIEITLDRVGGMSLNFLSYPTQLLLEPLRTPLTFGDTTVSNAIQACRQNEATNSKVDGSADLTILTSYFKDHLHADVRVKCGASRRDPKIAGPDILLSLTGSSAAKATLYHCRAK